MRTNLNEFLKEEHAKYVEKLILDKGKTLYICNLQHLQEDGTWYNHQSVVKNSLEGVKEYVCMQNEDLGGTLFHEMFGTQKQKRRLLVREVEIKGHIYGDLK